MTRWLPLLFSASLGLAQQGELLDRVAVTFENTAITLSEVRKEVVLTSFLNLQPVKETPATLRAAAKRLVERHLIEREVSLSLVSPPSPEEVQKVLDDFRTREFSSRTAYGDALTKYGVTEEQVKQQIARQLAVLRFIESRFRPELEVSEQQVEEYYASELVAKLPDGQTAPPLSAVKDKIRQILEERETDRRLNQWMDETADRIQVVYREKAFE